MLPVRYSPKYANRSYTRLELERDIRLDSSGFWFGSGYRSSEDSIFEWTIWGRFRSQCGYLYQILVPWDDWFDGKKWFLSQWDFERSSEMHKLMLYRMSVRAFFGFCWTFFWYNGQAKVAVSIKMSLFWEIQSDSHWKERTHESSSACTARFRYRHPNLLQLSL